MTDFFNRKDGSPRQWNKIFKVLEKKPSICYRMTYLEKISIQK